MPQGRKKGGKEGGAVIADKVPAAVIAAGA